MLTGEVQCDVYHLREITPSSIVGFIAFEKCEEKKETKKNNSKMASLSHRWRGGSESDRGFLRLWPAAAGGVNCF